MANKNPDIYSFSMNISKW